MSIIRTTVAVVLHARALPLTLAMALVVVLAPSARAQAASANPWVAPERSAHRPNPLPATTDAVKHGANLFHRDCEQCHGKAGHGDGPQGYSLSPRPADLASQAVQSQSDGALFWKISEGRGMMPKPSLADNEKWAVIDYLRTLAGHEVAGHQ